MDFYADAPMPSLEYRAEKLLKLVKNPTSHHVALANRVASETMNVSLAGWMNGVQAIEERRFLEAQGGSETSEPS